MPRLVSLAPITAMIYSDSARAAVMMRRLVAAAVSAGASIQGYVQHDVSKPGRSRCDMVLEDIATGHQLAISEDRGPGARGCQLDVDCLTSAMMDLRSGLLAETDLLVLNKFGKSEAEGGGFRPLIADAVERGVSVALGVSWRNIEAWRAYSGDLGHEVLVDDLEHVDCSALLAAFGLTIPTVGDDLVAAINPAHGPSGQ